MRKKAGLDEWAKLYEVATRVASLKPWDYLWDENLIAIQFGSKEDTIYYSILGRAGTCYGINAYYGPEGLNSFFLMLMSDELNISVEYAFNRQNCLSLCLGDRDEITDECMEVIKKLGLKYSGRNSYLYFTSYKPGCYPYILDKYEVEKMTEYLTYLEIALKNYASSGIKVDYDNNMAYTMILSEDRETWTFDILPLPASSAYIEKVNIVDELLVKKLSTQPRTNTILEIDIVPLRASVNNKETGRPTYPLLNLFVNSTSFEVLKNILKDGLGNPGYDLCDDLIDYIIISGLPKEIHVSNYIVEAAIDDLCKKCKIELKRLNNLQALNHSMSEFRRLIQEANDIN